MSLQGLVRWAANRRARPDNFSTPDIVREENFF